METLVDDFIGNLELGGLVSFLGLIVMILLNGKSVVALTFTAFIIIMSVMEMTV